MYFIALFYDVLISSVHPVYRITILQSPKDKILFSAQSKNFFGQYIGLTFMILFDSKLHLSDLFGNTCSLIM